MKDFKQIAAELGELVTAKNKAYGDSFARSGEVLKIMYPNGVKPEQYADLLCLTRILDKMFRIANGQLEDSYEDLGGYSILGAKMHSKDEDGRRLDNRWLNSLREGDAFIYDPTSKYSVDRKCGKCGIVWDVHTGGKSVTLNYTCPECSVNGAKPFVHALDECWCKK